MLTKPRSPFRLYAVALIAVVVAIGARLLLDPLLHDRLPFETVFAAIVFTAWYCGCRPALLSLALSLLGVPFFILDPRLSFAVARPEHRQGLFLYAAVALGTIALFESLRQAQAREAAQRELLHVTLASIGDAVIATDTQGQVTFVNSVAEQLTGWNGAEAIGRPMEEVLVIVNEQSRNPVENPALRAYREERIIGMANDTVLLSKAGRELLLDDSAAPIRDGAGSVIGAVMVFRDITERRRQEHELERQEKRFRLALSATGICVWEWMRADPRLWLSEGGASVLGFVPEAMVTEASQLSALLYPEDRAALTERVNEAIRLRQGYHIEVRTVRQTDGTMLWLETRGEPIFGPDGEVMGFVGVSLDVTRIKQVEQELREADRRKDEFLATLAHELRNPLTPIRNAIALLRLSQRQDAQLQRIQDLIDRQVGHMVRLVNDLLEVSRITRGKIELQRERLDLAKVVQIAIETSGPLIEEGRHELTVATPPQPVMVEGDGIRLTQVMTNLLNNASKFTPDGGHIWLTVERQEREAVIRVRDNGLGISADMLPRVFELFAQAHSVLKRAQSGLGIGLALVERLVQMHGGSVEAHSDGPGKGAEFIVHLPLASPANERMSKPGDAEIAACFSRCRILVVDDNVDAADTLADLLSGCGHDVHTAYDGAAGIEQAIAFGPEVILLDLGMPEMDGYETAQKVQQLLGREGLKPKLVALTGWGQEEHRRRTREAGFDAHLVKPVDCAVLQEVLASVRAG